jgi:UDP-glucuronate decarboxylase
LVTGGAGFIGSHLCARLVREGHDVLCLDNYFTGSKRNVASLRGNANFELVRHDVTEPILLEVDQVYNLACPASPVHYQFNPVKTVKTNVMGTLNMLAMCEQIGATFLQASTSEVYGDPEVHPQIEEYWGNVNPIGPRSCYDEGKRLAETLCMDFHRQNRVPVKIARIFNTYGPNMAVNDGRVVSNFIVQALRGQPITIYGTGHQTRAFCYVDDLVEGLIRLMNTPDREFTGPINLGNPAEFTMLELAHETLRLTESPSQLIFGDLPADDPRQRQPDISKAVDRLGWSPKVPLAQGLDKTIAYFRDFI